MSKAPSNLIKLWWAEENSQVGRNNETQYHIGEGAHGKNTDMGNGVNKHMS